MANRNLCNRRITPRLFANDWLERFSHVHPALPLIIYVPVVGYCLMSSTVRSESLAGMSVLYLVLGGVLTWTLVEYLIHRYVFHYKPVSELGKRIHFLVHGIHHDYPRDPKRLVMPPAVSIPLASGFYGVFLIALGPTAAPPFFAGFMIGYLCYDMIHYAVHHYSLKKSRVASWLKTYHLRHHYGDENHGFGVSSPLWDYILGTAPPRRRSNSERA